MGPRPFASLHPGPRVRRPVRSAVIVSVLVHVVLALVFFRHRVPAPAAPSVAIEVEVNVTPDQGAPALVEPGAGSARAALPAAPRAGERAGGRAPKVVTAPGPSETAGQAEAQGEVVNAPAAPGPAEPKDTNDRIASFRPRHPDLTPVPGPAMPEAKRDLLAAPQVPHKAPGELPRTLRGPGGVVARIDNDGQIHFRDPKAVTAQVNPAMGLDGRFDLNDQIMRLAGQDPYAFTKHKMAEATREQRLCMARRAQHARESQALFELSTNVRAIAERKDWTPEKRRRALFEIWDECDDGDSDYAAMARATITGIIRQVFPQGSAHAFTAPELLALNRQRTSPLEFAPYAAPAVRPRTERREDCAPPDAGHPIE